MDVSYDDVKIGMRLILKDHKCIITFISEWNVGKIGYPKMIVEGEDIDTGKKYAVTISNAGENGETKEEKETREARVMRNGRTCDTRTLKSF